MEYSLLSDEVLIKLLKANDEPAFKEIYSRYWKPLYRKAYLKVRRHEIAEEIVQNVFVKLWENRLTSEIRHLENYLQTAIKYQVINYYKSLLAKEKYLKSIKTNYAESEENPATNLLVHELSAIIDSAIHELPEKTQLVFNLSRNKYYSIKEISQRMHLSEKAVEYHITKSLRHLRFYLKEIVTLFFIFLTASLSC